MTCLIDAENFSEYEIIDSEGDIALVNFCTVSFDSMNNTANSYV